VALALSPAALWVKLVVPLLAFPLFWFLYGWFVGNQNALTTGYRTLENARRIAELVDTPVIVFGHTHDSELVPLGRGLTYANSGTWAPSWDASGRPTPGRETFVSVRACAGRCNANVGSWQPLAPAAVSCPEPRAANASAPSELRSLT
jgi:hypothetical protein